VRDAYLQRRLAATRRKSADKDNGGDDGM
jgi:hypothetical protein